jgi:cytochrome c-type biogenesis protein CcmE
MKAWQRRGLVVAAALSLLGVATALVLSAFRDNLVFFYSPSQVMAGEAPPQRGFRLGGLVEDGSLQRAADGLDVRFVVTDNAQRVPVLYRGALPDLFREGRGVVAQGRLEGEGAQRRFVAAQVLAKHDENYMPPEAAQALRQAQAGQAPQATGGRP